MKLNMRDYQKDAYDFLMKVDKSGLFIPMGLGKTAIALMKVLNLVKVQKEKVIIAAPP